MIEYMKVYINNYHVYRTGYYQSFDEITPNRRFIKELKKGGLPLCTELTINQASDVMLGGTFKVHWADSKKHTQQAGGLWLFDGSGERGHNLRY